MSRRRSRDFNPSWTGSNKTLPRQRLTETPRKRGDGQTWPGTFANCSLLPPLSTVSQRIRRDREAITGIVEERHSGSGRRSWGGFHRSGGTYRQSSGGYYQLSSKREPVCRFESDSCRGTDVTTTSDLRPNHQPHCEHFPTCLFPLC